MDEFNNPNNNENDMMNDSNIQVEETEKNEEISGGNEFYNSTDNIIEPKEKKGKKKILLLSLIIIAILAVGGFGFVAYKTINGGFGNKWKNLESKNIDMISSVVTSLTNTKNSNGKSADLTLTASLSGDNSQIEMIDSILQKIKINLKLEEDKDFNFASNFSIDIDDDSLISVDYIKDATKNYFKIAEIYDKYIMLDENDISKLSETLGYENTLSDEDMKELEEALKDISIEDIDYLYNTYSKDLIKNISDEDITKEKNKEITLNGKEIKTSAYTVEFKNINTTIINTLEDLKKDDKALEKMLKFCKVMVITKMETESKEAIPTNKEELIKVIDEGITKIKEDKTDFSKEYPIMIAYINKDNILRREFSTFDVEKGEATTNFTVDFYESEDKKMLDIYSPESSTNIIFNEIENQKIDFEYDCKTYEKTAFKGNVKINENELYIEVTTPKGNEKFVIDFKKDKENLNGKISASVSGYEATLNITGTIKDITKVTIPDIKDENVTDIGKMTEEELEKLFEELEENTEIYIEKAREKVMSALDLGSLINDKMDDEEDITDYDEPDMVTEMN